MMSGNGLDIDPLFSMSQKTPAQIISEAKASIYDPVSTGSQRSLHAKVVTTSRPYTPKQKERHLYTTRARTQRPSSSVHLKNCIIEEEYFPIDDRPPSTCGVRLIPLKTPPRSVSVDSFIGIEPLPSIRDSSSTVSLGSTVKLPNIGPVTQHSRRQQFRRPLDAVSEITGISEKSNPVQEAPFSKQRTSSCTSSSVSSDQSPTDEKDEFTIALDNLKCAQADEFVISFLEEIIRILETTTVKSSHRKSLMSALTRHLSSDNALVMFSLVDVMLVMKVTRNNFILAAKILFKLARDDLNDHQFEKRKTLELFLLSLSRSCPTSDSEAFVYGYGALKFLTLNSKLIRILENIGFIQLAILHLKLLCNPTSGKVNENDTSNVLFQITSSLRNMMSSAKSKVEFTSSEGRFILEKLITEFSSDVDIACNVARIISVLSADEDICESDFDNESFIDNMFSLLISHASRRDVVVRVTFALGNIAAKCSESRLTIAKHPEVALLSQLLMAYVNQLRRDCLNPSKDEDIENVDFGGSSGTVEDTCVKIIRVIANSSIHPEAGSALALSESTVGSILKVAEAAAETNKEDLLLPTLAALNNLSFYSIVQQHATYSTLKSFLIHSNIQVVAETARVFGNLSRRQDIRAAYPCVASLGKCIWDLIGWEKLMTINQDGVFTTIIELLLSEDRDLAYACVGILVNLMSDQEHRPLFKEASGVLRCIEVLENCVEHEDWPLATLVCQAMWNYSIDSNFASTMDEDSVRHLEDVLVYLLEVCNDSAAKKASDYEGNILHVLQGEEREFCQVGMGLLKRIMDDCPQPLELLLDDNET